MSWKRLKGSAGLKSPFFKTLFSDLNDSCSQNVKIGTFYRIEILPSGLTVNMNAVNAQNLDVELEYSRIFYLIQWKLHDEQS